MATVRQSSIEEVEELHARNAELETEIISLTDQCIEKDQKIVEISQERDTFKARLQQVMSDRSMAV